MKSKHYPLLTAVIGTALVFVPCLILFLVLAGSSAQETLATNEAIDNAIASRDEPSSRVVERSSPSQEVRTADRHPGAIAVATVPDKTQVAVAGVDSPRLADSLPEVRLSHLSPVESPAPLYGGSSGDGHSSHESLPDSVEHSTVPEPQDELMPIFTNPDVAGLADANENAGPELIEIPRRPAVDESYYQATGHLAMANQGQVADPLRSAPDAIVKETGEAVSGIRNGSGKKSSSSRRRPKKEAAESDETTPAESVASSEFILSQAAAFGLPVRAGAKDSKNVDPSLLEDVIIQMPAEGQGVGRVEDLVASTAAKGWPIALVRSDLPDDVWWVQQVVGINGNSFGARVNFGNEYSVRGSVYDMVIVFLDSPDEVRRFRIAKQFKDIPAGVRRSREFRYIRK